MAKSAIAQFMTKYLLHDPCFSKFYLYFYINKLYINPAIIFIL